MQRDRLADSVAGLDALLDGTYLAVGSLPGLVADLLSMATGGTMLLRRSSVIATAVMAASKLVAGRI
jgi:hypothetical protein